MIMTIVIVAAFNNSTKLTNAYGFAVATVMFSTTILISVQIRYVKHLPAIVGILFLLTFGFFDGD
jgi:KUP system potassium uptake protein